MKIILILKKIFGILKLPKECGQNNIIEVHNSVLESENIKCYESNNVNKVNEDDITANKIKEIKNDVFCIFLREKIEKELEEIKKEENFCKDNWDGYGAKAISQKSIDMMFDYLSYFDKDMAIPEIMLEPYGTIALYWGTENGNFFISFNDKINKIEFALTNKYTHLNVFGVLESINNVKNFIKMI